MTTALIIVAIVGALAVAIGLAAWAGLAAVDALRDEMGGH